MEDSLPFSDIVNDIINTLDEKNFSQKFASDNAYDDLLVNAYENLKDKDKVKKKVNELLESFVTSSLDKNVEKSVLFRDAGNKYFKENKYQQALDCYNKSIFLAPCPRNLEQNNEEFLEFSMGLTNRCC